MPNEKVTTTNGDVDDQQPDALDERPAEPQDDPQPEEEPHDPPTEDSGENSTETHSAGASMSDAVASNPDFVVEGTL